MTKADDVVSPRIRRMCERHEIDDDVSPRIRRMCERHEIAALKHIQSLAALWPYESQITPNSESLVLVAFAKLMFARGRTEDDADVVGTLYTILQALLDATEPTHGCSSKEKREHLNVIVARLELVMGVAVSAELGELAEVQAIDLNTAGERSEVNLRRPEDVPEVLRKVTTDYWIKAQSAAAMTRVHISDSARVIPGEQLLTLMAEPDSVLVVDEAKKLVDAARADGAFLVPWENMPPMQRQFWMQRVVGIDHGGA